MTGGEIPIAKTAAAAARATGAAGRDLVSEDPEVKAVLADIARETGALDPAAQTYAQRVAVRQQIALRVIMPIARLVGVSREYFEQNFNADLAEKLAPIPEERLTTPRHNLSMPVLQGLAFAAEEPDLKEMYLNLLATASDVASQERAHPGFAEIVRQLSPPEAELLLTLLVSDDTPLVRIQTEDLKTPGEFTIRRSHVANLLDEATGEIVDPPLFPIWVGNWVRLGLVEVHYELLTVASAGAYDWIEDHPAVKRARQEWEPGPERIIFGRGILSPTDFGQAFAEAVSPRPFDEGFRPFAG